MNAAALLEEMVCRGDHSSPLTVWRLKGASILWVNREKMARDPLFKELGQDEKSYEQALLERCAWWSFVDRGVDSSHTKVAFADRYGGRGIEGNGGAGRAALLDGYYVKGVGPTRLLGKARAREHSSGGCYLEEAVREAVFAEVAAAEMPYGAVRTLAIIDSGCKQHWPEVDKYESMVLVIRLPFIRPAHFDRALDSRCDGEQNGATDAKRVRWCIEAAERRSPGVMTSWLCSLPQRVAAQTAFGYAQRLEHGSTTLSNMTVEGRLVDFGASSSLPGLGSYRLIEAAPAISAVGIGGRIANMFGDLRFGAGRWAPMFEVDETAWSRLRTLADSMFEEQTTLELIRTCGLPGGWTNRMPAESFVRISREIGRLVQEYGSKRLDLRCEKEFFGEELDLHRIHDKKPPAHLKRLAAELERLGCVGVKEFRSRSRFLCSARTMLYRERAKDEIYAAVDEPGNAASKRARVEHEIQRRVVFSRRVSRVEMDGSSCVGFAATRRKAFTLMQRGGEVLAVPVFLDGRRLSGAVDESIAMHIGTLDRGDLLVAPSDEAEWKGAQRWAA
jgi:hypothetical protein